MMPGVQAPRTPSWRALGLLALAVLLVHLLLLQSAPLALMSRPATPAPLAAPVLITRSIAPEPPAAQPAPAPQPPPPAPAAKSVKPPRPAPKRRLPDTVPAPQPPLAGAAENYDQNQAPAQVQQGPEATESVAEPSSDAEPANAAAVPPADAAAPGAEPATPPAVPPALPPTAVSAVKFPESLTLRYRMTGSAKGLDYFANGELTWQNSGDAYTAGLRVSAFLLGARSMSSQGRITPSGLAPTRFSDKSRSELAAHFEPDRGRITFSANTPDAPWLEGAQDRVSVFFQLAGILAAAPGNQTGATALPLGTEVTVYTVGPREADTWTFLVEGEELLSLPAGEMVALKLIRKPRRPYDQQVEIWYAASQAYMPVRSRITQANGDFIDQQLRSVETP